MCILFKFPSIFLRLKLFSLIIDCPKSFGISLFTIFFIGWLSTVFQWSIVVCYVNGPIFKLYSKTGFLNGFNYLSCGLYLGCCLFWPANGCFTCHLMVEIIFFAFSHLFLSQMWKLEKRARKMWKILSHIVHRLALLTALCLYFPLWSRLAVCWYLFFNFWPFSSFFPFVMENMIKQQKYDFDKQR